MDESFDQLQPPVAEEVVEAPEASFGFNAVEGLQTPVEVPENQAGLDATGQFANLSADTLVQTDPQEQSDATSSFTAITEISEEESSGGGLLKRYLGGDS